MPFRKVDLLTLDSGDTVHFLNVASILLYNNSDFSFDANMVGFCRDSHNYS